MMEHIFTCAEMHEGMHLVFTRIVFYIQTKTFSEIFVGMVFIKLRTCNLLLIDKGRYIYFKTLEFYILALQ